VLSGPQPERVLARDTAPASLAIFDFDGTLADTWPWFVTILDEAAVRFRFRRVDAAELDQLRHLGSREIIRALRVRWWQVPAIARYMRARATAEVSHVSLFPGAADLLRDIAAAGMTIAIVTSNTEPNVRHVLGAELAAKVAVYECGASLFGKPKKFRRALHRGRAEPAKSIAVGDEVRDVEAAHAVGVASAAVLWGYASSQALRGAGATHVCATFDALRTLLLRDAR
jgi:phosphoglycolate phosphatase